MATCRRVKIGRAVQQECRDRSRMPSSATTDIYTLSLHDALPICVQQTYKHSVPRFFVPEHGTMFTLALVRFPPTATKEIQYLNAKGALTYTDIAGDPVLYGNLPPREISMKDVFRSGDSSK